ncbi:MAG: hypothetical protein RMJ36_06425 [Candidatus Calescibacterium sp.]|nr:hypothetical protein [Candidatus Calescibacterium sp.]MDW8133270.1 hypothetical protein [Candidatus Calescibacterium sp.]
MESIEKDKIYKIKEIVRDKPSYMNYGLIEDTLLRVIDKSSDNKNFYLEVIGFNRKIAISVEFLQDIVLEEVSGDQKG